MCYLAISFRKSSCNVCIPNQKWLRCKSYAPVRLGSIWGGDFGMRKLLIIFGFLYIFINTLCAGLSLNEQDLTWVVIYLILSMFGWRFIWLAAIWEGG